MHRSLATSTHSLADTAVMFCLGTALLFYLLPWVINPGIQLTMGAYDLAEWASLHPVARAEGLFIPLLLRLPLLLLIWIITLYAGRIRFSRAWWLSAGVVLVGAVALLPPVEFFTVFRDDPNYQQQFVLTLGMLVGGVLGLSGILERFSLVLIVGLALTGVGISIAGAIRGLQLMHDLELPTTPGIGAVGLVSVFLYLGALMLRTR